MRRHFLRAVAIGALLAGGTAQAQTQPKPPAPGMPPGDEGLTRSPLSESFVALAYPALSRRVVEIEALRTAEDVRARQRQVRQRILDRIGGLPDRTNPLNARVTRKSEGEGFREENLAFDSLPGMRVTANLYLPATGAKAPAIVAFPGHGPWGKLAYHFFGISMAREGIAVLSIDLPGEGERVQYVDPATGQSRVGPSTSEHGMDAFAVMAGGDHVARYFINDGMRAIDYLASRADIDASKIGVFGCSGGGTVAAYVGGLDTRVKATAVACYMNDFAHLLPVQGPQEAEQTIPGFIPDGLDLPDWMELAAPNPYAIVSTYDDMFPYTGARAAYQEGRQFWGLLGASGKLSWITGPGGHGNIAPLQGQIAAFFHDALGGVPGPSFPAPPFRATDEWRARLQVTESGQVSTAPGGSATIQSANAARALKLAAKPAVVTDAEQAAALNAKLAAVAREVAAIQVIPGGTPQVDMGDLALDQGFLVRKLSFQSFLGLLPAALVQGAPDSQGPVMLLMEADALDPVSATVRKLAGAGWRVLVIQARGAEGIQRGEDDMIGDQNRMALRAFVVGRTLPGIRADDLIAALDWLQSKGMNDVSLMAIGSATVPAAHVALLDGRVHTLVLEKGLASWRNAVSLPMQQDLPPNTIPGALRHYDLPDLITATRACKVVILDPADGMGAALGKADIDSIYAQPLAWLNHGRSGRLQLLSGGGDLAAGALECPR